MEQQLDAFTQKRFELMVEMAVKKLQQELLALKENISSLNSEMSSIKSQITRLQFSPQGVKDNNTNGNSSKQSFDEFQKKVEIVDCRPESERHEEFQGGSAKNSEPLRPRYGDYKPEDVSIDKFFYFGRK